MLFKRNKADGIFDLKDNDLNICIHKLVGCGNAMFLNCRSLNIKDYDLHTEDFGQSVKNAQEIIFKTANNIVFSANRFVFDDTSIKFTDW